MQFRTYTLLLVLLLALSCQAALAQGTAFTHQGRLTDNNAAASGAYDLQFALFDALSGGAQQGATLTRDDVPVTNGVFTVTLDFGAAPFTGAPRWLQISVRNGASTGAFTPLNPRQPLAPTPYALRSLTATSADALSANCVGCITATQLQGGGNFIQNTTTQQAASNFNISGDGTAGGTLSGNVVNAATQFNLGGHRVLAVSEAASNIFAGLDAGVNTTPSSGGLGSLNSFFGNRAGLLNTTGASNVFVGNSAGTGNTTGSSNIFVGPSAGLFNTTGRQNAFIGGAAGIANTTGSNNTVLGAGANVSSGGLSHATAIGAEAVVSNSNTVVLGRGADTVVIPGTFSSSILSNPGTSNTLLGNGANLSAPGLTNATAIGAGAVATFSNSIVLGRNNGADRVRLPGGFLGAVALNDSLLLPRSGTDFSHYLGYDSLLNGTTFGAPGGFRWVNTTGGGSVQRMRLDSSGLNVSGDLTLNDHSLRLRAVNDDSHRIGYDSDINGIEFRAFDQFQWVRTADNSEQMILRGNGDLVIRGNYLRSSDGRYKTDVQTLPQALAQVLRLRGVRYHWKPEFNRDPRPQLGFIAQEVEAVLPELVNTDDKGFKSVAYANVVPVLVEAIKEQQQQLEALKSVKAENAALKAQLAASLARQAQQDGQQQQIEELKTQLAALAAQLPQPKAAAQRSGKGRRVPFRSSPAKSLRRRGFPGRHFFRPVQVQPMEVCADWAGEACGVRRLDAALVGLLACQASRDTDRPRWLALPFCPMPRGLPKRRRAAALHRLRRPLAQVAFFSRQREPVFPRLAP